VRVFVHLHRIFVRVCSTCVCVWRTRVRAAALCEPSRGAAATCGINSSAPRRAMQPRVRGCVRCHPPGSRASSAGVTWTSRTAKAEWADRAFHTSVIDAAGTIYVIGGQGTDSTTFYADVWASTDGGAVPDSVEGGRGVLGGYSGVLGALSGY
jgi:hypothetical protein